MQLVVHIIGWHILLSDWLHTILFWLTRFRWFLNTRTGFLLPKLKQWWNCWRTFSKIWSLWRFLIIFWLYNWFNRSWSRVSKVFHPRFRQKFSCSFTLSWCFRHFLHLKATVPWFQWLLVFLHKVCSHSQQSTPCLCVINLAYSKTGMRKRLIYIKS